MIKYLAQSKQWVKNAYWSAVGMTAAAMLSLQPAFAANAGTGTIWARFSAILKDVYGQIVAISTIVAVTVAAIAQVEEIIEEGGYDYDARQKDPTADDLLQPADPRHDQ